MALRNPYSEYTRTGDEESYSRDALLRAMESEPPPTARPRTPTRSPEQRRELLDGPGGHTNTYSGDRFEDERQAPEPPASTTAAGTANVTPFTSNRQRGYELMDAYDDPYTRRNEGAGGVWSNAAKYAQTGAGVGSAFAGVGAVPGAIIGGIGGAIGGAFAKNAKTAMTDFAIDDARQIISKAHQDAFGREITPEQLDQIVRGQGWKDGDRWMGQDSLAYVLDAFAQQAGNSPHTESDAPAPGTTTPPAGASGDLGNYAGNLEGFAMERFADPNGRGNNTVKYQVGRVLSRHAPNAEGLAAAAEELRGLGFDVQQGGKNGDLLEFGEGVVDDNGNPIGTIDVGRGFGAAGSGWAWQPQGGAGASGGGTITGTSGARTVQDAYAWLKQNADPSWTREEMQAAINAAFADVPGFIEGYAGDAVFDNGKLDLITNFEGPGATWSDNLSLIPMHGGGSGASPSGGAALASGLNLAPGVSLAAPLGNSDVYAQIQAALQRLMSGSSTRDELIGALG